MHDAPSFFKGNLLKVVLRHMLTQLLITHGLGGYRENVLLESPAIAGIIPGEVFHFSIAKFGGREKKG